MSINLHPDSPQRDVEWRWQKAILLRENKGRIWRRQNDPWIKKAHRFQIALDKCKDDYDRFQLLESNPSIYFAYNIRATGEDKVKAPLKAEIEARLLTNDTYVQIASRCGCSAETIDIYEKLFFNVKDRLQNTGYILHQVIGPAVHRGMTQRDYDVLWKLYAYFCGSAVLDAVTSTFTNPVKPETPEQVDALFVDDTRAVMRRKAAYAARAVPINEFTQTRILELYAKFLEVEKETEGSSGGHDLILNNIEMMMTSLPWAMGSAARKADTRLVKYYDNKSAELRSNELLDISFENEKETHKAAVDIIFPEAPSHDKRKDNIETE